MSAFRDWLAKAQPLLAHPGADKVWPGVVGGMELAWDAALDAAIEAASDGGTVYRLASLKTESLAGNSPEPKA